MSESAHAAELTTLLARLNAGDRAARDEMLRHLATRLERLTRKMLRDFPGVRRWAQTDDVLQGALLRLTRSLEEVRPTTLRAFLGLSSTLIRRELLDLARKHYGPEGVGANHASVPAPGDNTAGLLDPPARTEDPLNLAAWQEFHATVQELPPEQREVVELVFYQGLSQPEAATLLEISLKTVQRRWHKALETLQEWLQGNWPGV